MSDLQGRRIPGEEGSRRRRPILWIVLALIALLLLDLLIPFAREAFAGDGGGGFSGIPLMTFAVVSSSNSFLIRLSKLSKPVFGLANVADPNNFKACKSRVSKQPAA